MIAQDILEPLGDLDQIWKKKKRRNISLFFLSFMKLWYNLFSDLNGCCSIPYLMEFFYFI